MKRRFFLQKLLVYFVAISVPLFILSASFYAYSSLNAERDVNHAATNKSTLGVQYLENILDVFPGNGSLFGNSAALTKAIWDLVNSKSLSYSGSNNLDMVISILNNYSNTKPYIDSIYIYADNPNGYFLRSGYGLSNLAEQTYTAWYDHYLEVPPEETFWIHAYQGANYRFETLHRMISAYYRFPNMPGVIVINFNEQRLQETLDSLVTYQQEQILVTDLNGMPLFGNSDANANLDLTVPIGEQVGQKGISGTDGLYNVAINGKRHVMIEAVNQKLGIRYCSLISADVLYALPQRILLFSWIALCFGLLVSLYLSFLLTRRNYRQVERVINVISDAETGRYVRKEPTREMDEFDVVLNNVIDLFLRNSFLQLQMKQLALQKQLAEFRSLQLQINPHFLYNTLQIIDMQLRFIHTTIPSNIITNLSDILRYSLEIKDPYVTVREEIDVSKKYLNIQHLRYPTLFSTVWDYEEEMLELPVLRLILQPILENSLQHGIIPSGKRGVIKVKFELAREGLIVHVLDNGVGISPEEIEALRRGIAVDDAEKGARHIGLWNVNKRLLLTYSGCTGLRVYSKKGLGTSVSFVIPRIDINKPKSNNLPE